jgi:hypothetical protein
MKNEISAAIIRHLESGFLMDRDICSFAESGLGLDSPGDIAAALEGDDERGLQLRDLLLYPDSTFSLSLESMVPDGGIGEDGISEIRRELERRVATIRVKIPGSEKSAGMIPSEKDLAKFLNRLGLQRPVPPSLNEKTAGGNTPSRLAKARLYIRKSPLPESGFGEAACMAKALAASCESEADFDSALHAGLDVMCARTDDSRLADLLVRERRRWRDAFRKRLDFEEISKRYSMDILMRLRITPPPEGRDAAMEKIRLINIILSAIEADDPAELPGGRERLIEGIEELLSSL